MPSQSSAPSSSSSSSSSSSTPPAAQRGEAGSKPKQPGMSYKFQRLREKIRQAIGSGELVGKLPGERALAKRFHVNAKTLSKALTDLAAEGLLDRSIGRGTYVKGSAPAPSSAGRWLLLCDDADPADAAANGRGGHAALIELLKRENPDAHVAPSSAVPEMRPSFLNAFSAVIDLATATPEPFLRDLVVRNMPVVAVGREPRSYSVPCVLVDAHLGAARAARDLLLAGHRRLGVVEPVGPSPLSASLRHVASSFSADATVDAAAPGDDAAGLVEHGGVTALVCGSPESAAAVRDSLGRAGVDVPGQVSLVAVGSIAAECGTNVAADDSVPCSGYYVDCARLAEAVVKILQEAPAAPRPATLWLAGDFVDRGTVARAGRADATVVARPASTSFNGVLV